MLLEYLAPSRARREVWKALRSQRGPLTVRELSRSAGLPYSNAHREIARMRELGLLKTRSVGKALLCEWDDRNPASKLLVALLDLSAGPSKEQSNDEDVYWNLKSRGAPLARTVSQGRPLSLEETLAYGVEVARRDPDVAQTWPVVFAKNRAALDLKRLEVLSRRLGQKRALGFLLSLTGMLLKDPELLSFARRLRDSRVTRVQDFFTLGRGKRSQRLADMNTPRVAKDWHFRMNTSMEGFESHFFKFVPKS